MKVQLDHLKGSLYMKKWKAGRSKKNIEDYTAPLFKVSKITRFISYLVLAILVIVIGLPIILTILYSILPTGIVSNLGTQGGVWNAISFDGYKQVFVQLPFIKIILNSIFISFTSTGLQLIVSFITAFAIIHWDYPGKDYIFGFIVIAMIIPSISIMIPNYLTVSSLGMVKKYSGVIIPGIANAYGIFLMRQFFLKVPKSLVEACRMDGGNSWDALRHVYLPLSLPAVTALFIILIVVNWNDYQWPLLILQEANTLTLPLAIVRFRNEGIIDWMPTAAACMMAIVPILIIYLFLQRQMVDTFASSATKG